MCLKFGLDKDGEVQVEGYCLPKDGKNFTKEELQVAYLMAASESKSLEKDEKAKELLQMYTGVVPLGKDKEGVEIQVGTWKDEDLDAVEDEDGVVTPLASFGLAEGHCVNEEVVCHKCAEEGFDREKNGSTSRMEGIVRAVLAGKKYKPVALKTRPIYTDLPEQYRIKREILGDPLEGMPELPVHPTPYVPVERYEQDRKDFIDDAHPDFLKPQERMLLHNLIVNQKDALAWNDLERGTL